MRRTMMTVPAAVSLAVGAVVGVAGPAMAQPDPEPAEISVVQCLIGGGLPLPISESTPDELICLGGYYNGRPVTKPQQPGN
ncbi:hypothetical protein SAMN05216188_127117 [Lentzea xinjiangensis]|uniref:Secreted protein n=1 Tax=Lentzea xinjiangensis TaxID=402600 RepID=A0A1H9VRW8_9PSEU|nr:hypothetical protein [Lentzea xinjiangensis]SES24234.1 hypothetical protein SAMN05216188_127117 [Lentzea xinjiangensis]